MKLYRTKKGIIAEFNGQFYLLNGAWEAVINRTDLHQVLKKEMAALRPSPQASPYLLTDLLPPIDNQEVWAAGVTYSRSKEARMDESKKSGASVFYDNVYDADRPEIFFKATPQRVVGHNQTVRIRKDSTWNVPESELTLFISSDRTIEGYTIGNDMSSRSIEGENPLYLPQAKTYDGSCALGPCLYIPEAPIPSTTGIHLSISRKGNEVFNGDATLTQMKRSLTELASWLTKETSFPTGVFLMTGTCLVPPDGFTLQPKDVVTIAIDNIGILTNTVA
jgi:2-dehydro-3-deoxy-D-arabinonate dehydratase